MSLKEYRIKVGLTQEEVARATGILLRTYQNIERNNDCKLSTARAIATILNDSIENIFFEKK